MRTRTRDFPGTDHETSQRLALDVADHVLAGLVGGVGLAGEHELHRSGGVQQQAAQPVGCAAF